MLAPRHLSVLVLLASVAVQANAQETESFLLRGRDDAGRTIESRVELTSHADGTLWLERVAFVQGQNSAFYRAGVARRDGFLLRAELQPTTGLVGRLSGSAPAPALHVSYFAVNGWLSGVVRESKTDGRIVAREYGRRLAEPLAVARYTLASSELASANDAGQAIDVAALNAGASALLRSLTPAEREVEFPVIVVPGFASAKQDPAQRLHERSKKRARWAARALRKKGAHVILCSGSNVHPENTPFNEALELRRYLINKLGVPPWRVAIDPYARHTTTNVRNAGRFLLAHDLKRALIITTAGQSFYLSAPRISTFHKRCRETLGYEVGELDGRSPRTTLYMPSRRVISRGPDPLDP